jgi:hypothetical protein
MEESMNLESMFIRYWFICPLLTILIFLVWSLIFRKSPKNEKVNWHRFGPPEITRYVDWPLPDINNEDLEAVDKMANGLTIYKPSTIPSIQALNDTDVRLTSYENGELVQRIYRFDNGEWNEVKPS